MNDFRNDILSQSLQVKLGQFSPFNSDYSDDSELNGHIVLCHRYRLTKVADTRLAYLDESPKCRKIRVKGDRFMWGNQLIETDG